MKGKRFFAVLVAVCMVLSTFVSVSADDYVVEVNIQSNFEDGLGDLLNGNEDLYLYN